METSGVIQFFKNTSILFYKSTNFLLLWLRDLFFEALELEVEDDDELLELLELESLELLLELEELELELLELEEELRLLTLSSSLLESELELELELELLLELELRLLFLFLEACASSSFRSAPLLAVSTVGSKEDGLDITCEGLLGAIGPRERKRFPTLLSSGGLSKLNCRSFCVFIL